MRLLVGENEAIVPVATRNDRLEGRPAVVLSIVKHASTIRVTHNVD